MNVKLHSFFISSVKQTFLTVVVSAVFNVTSEPDETEDHISTGTQ